MADGSGIAGAEGAADNGAAAASAGAAASGEGAGAGAAAGAGTGAGTAAVIAPVQEAPQWHSGIDDETKGWLQLKGWFGPDITKADLTKSLPEMVKSHRSLESVVGRNRVAVPKDINDKEGWDAYWAAGGRPADPKGYELKAGEGGEQVIADKFAEIAHSRGLSTWQAQGLVQEFTAYAQEQTAARQAAADQTFVANSQAEFDGLRQEWGSQSDARMAAAQRAKIAAGLDDAVVDKIERAIGTKAMVTMFSNFGMGISEDSGAGAAGGGGMHATTKEAARARMTEMKADKEWTAKYLAGGAEQVEEWNRLEKVLAGVR